MAGVALADSTPRRAYIGLGSNMGDKRAMIAVALDHLRATPGIAVVARSRDYRTPPWGDTDQDWFINACAALDTTLTPDDLLAACLAVETRMERVRTRRWGPRVIDIDLLDYDRRAIRSDRLTLPHPRILERAFVLTPLAEIAGDLPLAASSVREHARRLADPAIVPLDDTSLR
ncbi:2-amino-4-hydroxy-6-hydroxymethyldihydropteridine diphosphokinase [Pseudochelatococcus sp. B33]